MIHQGDLAHEMKRLFNAEPDVIFACEAIIEYLSKQASTKEMHLTYPMLRAIARPANDRVLLSAIQYLTGIEANLLEMKYEFLDEEGEYHPIAKKAVADARYTLGLVHPISGEIIKDYQSALLVYFTPNQDAQVTPDGRRIQGG